MPSPCSVLLPRLGSKDVCSAGRGRSLPPPHPEVRVERREREGSSATAHVPCLWRGSKGAAPPKQQHAVHALLENALQPQTREVQKCKDLAEPSPQQQKENKVPLSLFMEYTGTEIRLRGICPKKLRGRREGGLQACSGSPTLPSSHARWIERRVRPVS